MPSGSAVLESVRKVTAKTAATLKAQLRRIEDEKQRVNADLDEAADRLRQTLQQLGRSTNGNGAAVGKSRTAALGVSAGRKRKRTRRSLGQLKQEAEAIIQFIKGKGSEGASGPEIRQRHDKIGPDLKGFVKKY